LFNQIPYILRTHHLLKSAAVFLLVTLVSCEKELQPENKILETSKEIEHSHSDDGPDIEKVDFESIPKPAQAKIASYNTAKNSLEDVIQISLGRIPTTSILSVKSKKTGYTNYTFPIVPNEETEHTLLNLILPVDSLGIPKQPYAIEYTMTPSFAEELKSGNVGMEHFTGQMRRFYLDEQITFKGFGCPEGQVDDGNVGGGGGMPVNGNDVNDPGDGPSDGYSYPCSMTTSFVKCCGPNGDVAHSAAECGCESGKTGSYYVTYVDCSISPGNDSQLNKGSSLKDDGNCPQPEGEEGVINIYAHIVQTLDAALDLTPQQEAFLLEPDNEPFLQDLHNFWYFSSKDVNTQNFLKEVITVLSTLNSPTPTVDNYPGNNNGFPFEWWKDESFVEQNISFNIDEGISELTNAEKLLVAIFPVQALIIRDNKLPAETETQNRFGNNGINDKSDAFRHGFFNAMNSNDAGDAIARLFSTAHESEVQPHLNLEKQMDLFNNNVGHIIGHNANFFVSDNILSNSVYQNLQAGNLVYLWPVDYNDPNFWDNPLTPEPNDGSHGISNSTQLTPSDQ